MQGVRVGAAGVVLARTVGSAVADGSGTDTDGSGTDGSGPGVKMTPLGGGDDTGAMDRNGVAGGSDALARLEGVGAGARGVMDTNATVEAVTTRPLARIATMRASSP